MKLNKFGMLCLCVLTLSSMAKAMIQVVIMNQNAELIRQVDYLKALIEENGGGR